MDCKQFSLQLDNTNHIYPTSKGVMIVASEPLKGAMVKHCPGVPGIILKLEKPAAEPTWTNIVC